MYRKKRIHPFIFVVIILGLSYFCISLFLQNKEINEKLESYKIISFQGDELQILNGLNFQPDQFLLTENFIERSFSILSPFADERSFRELVKEEVKSRLTDIYGCYRVTENFSRIHEGVDFFVPRKTPVYPLFPVGIVTEISQDPHYKIQTMGKHYLGHKDTVRVEYGKIVRIAYPEGIESLYAHLDSVFVEVGDVVYGNSNSRTGTEVGLSGYTGNIKKSGKSSHLHLELRDSDKKSFDPEDRIYYHQNGIRHFLGLLDQQILKS